jgi:uncharacterized protein YggE
MQYILSFLIVGMLFVAGCAQSTNEAGEQENSIAVTGEGKVTVAPDMATLQLGIEAKNAKLQTAQGEAETITRQFIKLAKKLGIDDEDIQTTNATARPEYRYNRTTNEQELVGYIAVRQIAVKLSDLDKLGNLIEGAVSVGINQVSPPVLESSKAREAYREALQLAAKDARANARTLAKALDTEIDNVISVNATSNAASPRPMLRAAAMDMAESSEPSSYMNGQITYSASVTAVFEIEDD